MKKSRDFYLLLLSFVCFATLQGCAYHQLRFNTAGQAKTVADVHTQQVLDNLAKFAVNPNALPHFEYPNQGGSGVTDDANGTAGANFNPFGLTGWSIGAGARRTSNVSFTMTPINDPRKLELMRCAYQRAISPCCCNVESAGCPNCNARFNNFYLGSTTPSKTVMTTSEGRPVLLLADSVDDKNEAVLDGTQNPIGRQVIPLKNSLDQTYYAFLDSGEIALTVEEARLESNKNRLKKLYVDDSVAAFGDRNGTVTAACLGDQCWFKVGKKSLVPRSCLSCGFVGRYCGTYVWVPECGRDQLTKLTLTILDIAFNDPPKGRTKEVVAYLDINSALTTEDNAAFKVTTSLPLSASVSDAVPGAAKAAAAIRKLQIELSLIQNARESATREFDRARAQFGTQNKAILALSDDTRKSVFLGTTAQDSSGNFAGGIEELAIAVAQAKSNLLNSPEVKNLDDSKRMSLNEAINSAQTLLEAKGNLENSRQKEAMIQNQLRQLEIEQLQQRTNLDANTYEVLPAERSFDPAGVGVLQLEQRLRILGQ